MAFHKNLVEKDLHAPSRFKVKNENLMDAIPAFTAVAIEEFDGGLLTVIPIQASDHTGLYGITETIIPASGEGFITTFGILRDVTGLPVPVPAMPGPPIVPAIPGITQFDPIDINPNGGTNAGALIVRTVDPMDSTIITSAQVAIALTRPTSAGIATIFVTGGVPSSGPGGISGGGSAPSSIEEFKGFFDPNNMADDLPTDILPNTDNVRAGDYFIVNVDADGTNPNDIFKTLIVGDLVFADKDDNPADPFDADDFTINRTITAEEREILQDLKPADDGATGDILIVRPDPDNLLTENDYELRKPYTTDIDEPIDYPVSSPPATYPVNSVVRLPDGNIYRAIFDPTLINPITTRPSANLTDFLVTTDWAVVSSDSATKNLYVSHDERIQKLDPIPDDIRPAVVNTGAVLISDGVSDDLEFRIPTTVDVPDNGIANIPADERRYVSQTERTNKIDPLPDDIKPVAGTTDGFVIISDPSNSTDLQFRMADAAEVTVSDSVHFPSDNTVEEALVDLTARIRSISPNDFQGDWDATGEPAASEYRAGYFWRIEVNTPTDIIVGSPGVTVTVNTNDLIYYDGADAPSVANLEDFFVLEASAVPTDVIDGINFVSTTPGTQTQVGISFDTVRGVTTPLPLIQEDAIGTISIAVPPSDPNIVEISTSGDQIPVGTQITSPGVGGNPDIIIEATQEIDIGFTNINNKIDALVADDIAPFPDVSNNRALGNILIDDGGTELAFRHPTTEDIEVGGFTTGDLDGLEDPIPTEANGLINSILQGRVEFRGEYDPVADDFPSEVTDVNSDYIIRGWFWIVTGTESLGVSPTLDLVEGQLLFADPSTTEARKTGSLLDPISATDFFAAGGTSTGGGGGTGDSPFEGRFVSPDGPPDFDTADIGDYWIVTDNDAGSNFPAIPEDLSIGDLVIKLAINDPPQAGDYAVFYAANNVTTTFLGLTDVDTTDYPMDAFNATDNVATLNDIVIPVVNNDTDGLKLSSLLTFSGGGDIDESYGNPSLERTATGHGVPGTPSTGPNADALRWYDSVSEVRTELSSTPYTINNNISGLTHINGLTVAGGGISFDVSTTNHINIPIDLDVVSFRILTTGNVTIDGATEKVYDSNNPTEWQQLSINTGNDNRRIRITVTGVITRTDLDISGAVPTFTIDQLVVTETPDRPAGTTTPASVADYNPDNTNTYTFPYPIFNSLTATIHDNSGASISTFSIRSFLDSYNDVRLSLNGYNTPIVFSPLVATNAGTNPTLPAIENLSSTVYLTSSGNQQVTLDADGEINVGTSAYPSFEATGTWTYETPTGDQFSDAIVRSVTAPTLTFGYNVFQGTIPSAPFDPSTITGSQIVNNSLSGANFESANIITSLPDLTESITYRDAADLGITTAVRRIIIVRSSYINVGTSSLTFQLNNNPVEVFDEVNRFLSTVEIEGGDGQNEEFRIYIISDGRAALTTGVFTPTV